MMVKRKGKKHAVRATRKPFAMSISQKLDLVVKNLLGFFILSFISYILYKVISAIFWNDLFFLLTFVFGFVGLAFFIVWLVLMFLKASRK